MLRRGDGTDQASGRWTLHIDSATRTPATGDAERFEGPWTVAFDVP